MPRLRPRPFRPHSPNTNDDAKLVTGVHGAVRRKGYKRVSEKSFQAGFASLRSINLIMAAYTKDSSVLR